MSQKNCNLGFIGLAKVTFEMIIVSNRVEADIFQIRGHF